MTHSTPINPGWITLSQAANRLGVHPATLRRWVDEGEVPALLTPGGHRRFRLSDLDQFAEQHAQNHGTVETGRPPMTGRSRAMSVTCFGTNHRGAPIEFREQMMHQALELETAYAAADRNGGGQLSGVRELVVLATCNRTEVYVVTGEPGDDAWLVELASELTKRHKVTADELNERCYTLEELDAVHHLYRVTCGLDSMVVGESEIAGQVATALERAIKQKASGPVLTEIFQSAIRTGRRARTETAIGRGSASVSSVAVGLGRERLGGLDGRNVLVVGSGKMGRLAAGAFRGLEGAQLTIANRTREHALKLARGGERVIGLDELATALIDTDLVLTSTSAPETIIDKAMVERALRHRKSDKPIVFVDIAVPRDVEDAVGTLDNVHLFGIDDLRNRIDANIAERQAEVPHVDGIIDEELKAFRTRRSESDVRPIISALRSRAETIRKREVERFAAKNKSATHEDIEQLTRSLVNKLLHDPTAQLRRNADTYRQEEYTRVVRHLFALDDD